MCDKETPSRGVCDKVSKEVLRKLVRRHMVAAFGAGLVPLPLVDIAAITGVELNLVRKLSEVYGLPFSKNAVQGILSSLLGGAVPAMAGPSLASLMKAIPILGFPLGIVTAPGIAAAMTYAIGQVFIRHFEADGTLLTFDIEQARHYFKEMFTKGAEEASQMDLTVAPAPTAKVVEATQAPVEEPPPVIPSEKPAAKSGPKAAPAKRAAAEKSPAAAPVKKTAPKKSQTAPVKK